MNKGQKKERKTKAHGTLDLDALIQAAVIAYKGEEKASQKLGIPVDVIKHVVHRMKDSPSSSTWWRGAGRGFIRAAKMYGAPFMDWYLGHLDYTDLDIEEAIKNDMYWEVVMMSVVQGMGMSNEEVCNLIETATSMSRVIERIKDRKIKEKDQAKTNKADNEVSWVLKILSKNEEDYCNTNPSSVEIVK